MAPKTKDEFLTVRISGDTLRELRELAERNERTVAGEVRLAISERLDRETEEATA